MRADRSLRLPLQIGTSALLSLARGSLLAVPGLILLTIAVVIILWLPDMGDASGYLFLVISFPGFTVGAFAWKHLKRAHAERPSDLIVERGGFEVTGGPLHGRRMTWTEIRRVTIVTPPKPGKGKDEPDDSDLRVMTVAFVEKGELVLASAERAGEQQSLRELAQTLDAASRTGDDVKPPTLSKAVDLLVCAGCGAALAPIDGASIACPYCEHDTKVPDAMRAQVRDSFAVEHRPDATIAKLLDQPGAGLVGALFVTAAAFMMVAWPIAILLMFIEYKAGTLSFEHVLLLVAFVASCILGFYALIRTRLVDRQALRLMAVEFAAIEPAKPGEPYRCQHCLAPLPAAGENQVVVGCVYCKAANVLGLHLGREASIAREESRSLERALANRTRERRRWRGVTIVALGLLVASWFSLRYGVRMH